MYYHHTTLASLTQDDLYSILWMGGVATGILIPLFTMAITLKFIGKLDDHRGDSITGVVIGTLIRIFVTVVFVLFFVNFLYIAFMYGTQGSLGLNAGESIEWFLHTDWLNNLDNLIATINYPEGSEAREVAENTVASIYVVKYLWLLTLFGFAVMVLFSVVSKIHRMAGNNPKINAFEFSGSLIGAGFVGILILVGTIALMNGVIESIFALSDNIENTSLASYPPQIEKIYLDALNERLLSDALNYAPSGT